MMRRTFRFAPLALALLVSACGSTSSTTTGPSTSTGLTTDTFSGTVAVKGSDSKNFNVTLTGVVSVTLTAAPVPMTMSVGLPGGNGCAPINAGATVLATPGALAQLAGEVTPGTYCVLVADPGTLTAAAAYTVTVNHP
jgi:hypothetical protein